MLKEEKAIIADEVRRVTQGQRTRMKVMLGAMEEQFDGLALVCVDKKRDTIIYGSAYVSEQEMLYDEAQRTGGLNGSEGETCSCNERGGDKEVGVRAGQG